MPRCCGATLSGCWKLQQSDQVSNLGNSSTAISPLYTKGHTILTLPLTHGETEGMFLLVLEYGNVQADRERRYVRHENDSWDSTWFRVNKKMFVTRLGSSIAGGRRFLSWNCSRFFPNQRFVPEGREALVVLNYKLPLNSSDYFRQVTGPIVCADGGCNRLFQHDSRYSDENVTFDPSACFLSTFMVI
jgi:hypothetical protein